MGKYVSVIGGINIDIKGVPTRNLLSGTSNPGKVYISSGGVGRNIAHNLALLDVPVYLFGVVGDDLFGAALIDEIRQVGVKVEYIQNLREQQTGVYSAVLNTSYDLAVAVADMEIMRFVNQTYLEKHQEIIKQSRFVVLETNVAVETLIYAIELCRHHNIPYLIEPVSVEKAKKIHDIPGIIESIKPNMAELEALYKNKINHLRQLEDVCTEIGTRYKHILVTLGEHGVYYYNQEQCRGRHYLPSKTQIVDTNGAGDAFVAGFVCGLFHQDDIDAAIRFGMAAAKLTLQSKHTVSEHISFAACLSLVRSQLHNEMP